jgi:hypothetical protein
MAFFAFVPLPALRSLAGNPHCYSSVLLFSYFFILLSVMPQLNDRLHLRPCGRLSMPPSFYLFKKVLIVYSAA